MSGNIHNKEFDCEDEEEDNSSAMKKTKDHNPFNWNTSDTSFNLFTNDTALFEDININDQNFYNDFMINSSKNYSGKSNDDFETNVSKKSNSQQSLNTQFVVKSDILEKEAIKNTKEDELLIKRNKNPKFFSSFQSFENISTSENSSKAMTNDLLTSIKKSPTPHKDFDRNKGAIFFKVLQKQENPFSSTIKNIISYKNYFLCQFKTTKSKETILEYAINSFNSSAIITVVKFLKSSLNSEIFMKIMKKYPSALAEYINFLKETNHMSETNLSLFLELSKSIDEEIAFSLERCLYSNKSLEFVQNELSYISCKNNYYITTSDNLKLINDQLSLIKYQIDIEMNDKNHDNDFSDQLWSVIELAKKYISKFIIDSISINETLKRKFKLNQYTIDYLTIEFFCKKHMWKEIEDHFCPKSTFGIQKVKSNIPVEYIVGFLQKQNAPSNVLKQFVTVIDDIQLKLSFAESLNLYDIVVEILFNSKDQLNDFMKKLSPNDRTIFEIALASKKISK